jgi:hypothetical protein
MGMASRILRHWRVKGVVQKALGALPGGTRVNTALQQVFGELRDPRANFDAKFGDWRGLMALLAAAGRPSVAGAVLLEIGTGWYPTNPLLFALAGARECHTYDIVRHLDFEMSRRLLEHLGQHLDAVAALSGRDRADVRAHWDRLCAAPDLERLLELAGIRYHAPGDAGRTGLADGSVDIVFSNSVLEHVEPALLVPLLAESRRLVGARGLSVHAVACNDHYAHFDRSISFVNYLRFDDAQWARWNNPLNYQNRLRAPDFIAAARSAGLVVVHEERAVRPGVREALATLPVAARFSRYSPDDLAATTVNFVARG